jgi:hypothetical protein
VSIRQIIDAGVAAGSVLAVVVAWLGIRLTFRRGKELEEE